MRAFIEYISETILNVVISGLGVYIIATYFAQKYSIPQISFFDAAMICIAARLACNK